MIDWDAVWEEYERRGWVARLTVAEKQILQDIVTRRLAPAQQVSPNGTSEEGKPAAGTRQEPRDTAGLDLHPLA